MYSTFVAAHTQNWGAPDVFGYKDFIPLFTAKAFNADDVARLVGYFRSVGLPVCPADLGIDMETLVLAIRRGPEQRPGRTSILDGVGEDRIAALVEAYGRL